MNKKAFTILELLVAMALMVVLMAISAVVFKTSVQAQQAASATAEIMQKYQALTHQLKTDLGGLQKDAEFVVVWGPGPDLNSDGSWVDKNGDGVPDRYLSFDRLYFFAAGSFQSYDQQPDSTGVIVHSSMARICYSFGRDENDRQALQEPDPKKRLFCRTQHLLTSDGSLPAFPDFTAGWNEANFEADNFTLEYQTMPLPTWLNLDMNTYKREILAKILDLRAMGSVATEGGPHIYFSDSQLMADTIHQLLCKGVGQFHVQIWREDLQRWFPEIDPNFDGVYDETAGETDYPHDASDTRLIDIQNYNGYYFNNDQAGFEAAIGPALKFTFTLYDSRGVFPEGKTFTYIVYLNP
jgi:prepilin-type N-terminal cleavage/methylation domain-containing protein